MVGRSFVQWGCFGREFADVFFESGELDQGSGKYVVVRVVRLIAYPNGN